MTFAARMQHRIYWGPLKRPLEWSLKTVLAPWSYIASVIYHDFIWYPAHRERLNEALQSDWGRLFHNWERLAISPGDLETPGWRDVGDAPDPVAPEHRRSSKKHFRQACKILRECIREAPELAARRRRRH